jgi:hypothetical protein
VSKTDNFSLKYGIFTNILAYRSHLFNFSSCWLYITSTAHLAVL